MNSPRITSEQNWQDAAKHAAPEDETQRAQINAYRFVYQVVRSARFPPPPDFAALVMRRLEDFAEEASAEKWLLRAVLAGAALFAAWYWIPASIAALCLIEARNLSFPWQMMLAAAGGMTAVAVLERWHSQRRAGGAGP